MGFVFLVCCAAAGESPVDICLPGNGGKAAAVPLRYRLIALGFVKKLTPEEVNRKLAEEMAMSEENFYLYKTYLRSESSEKKWEKLTQ